MGIKKKRDLKDYIDMLENPEAHLSKKPTDRYEKNLRQLIADALEDMPRDDINLASVAGREMVAKHLASRMLTLCADKHWSDKYSYLF